MADFLHARGCAQANFSQFLRRENAEQHPSGYFDWMRRGADLYQALKLSHPLLTNLASAAASKPSPIPYRDPMADADLRWRQRFDNFELEQQGLIQGFEFTHELAWNLLKDYLQHQGIEGIIGSRDATRLAFQSGLISDGESWMAMIKAPNQSSHTYNLEQAQAIAQAVINRFAALSDPLP
jgi:nucleotidyltransferase substrate binding protein (TIGR01987 family)